MRRYLVRKDPAMRSKVDSDKMIVWNE